MPPNMDSTKVGLSPPELNHIHLEPYSIDEGPSLNSQDGSRSHQPTRIPFLDRLRNLPKRRHLPWQNGKELPPEKSTDSPRVQQRGACLLATRGDIAEKPCDHCAGGNGRFTTCITLYPWFQGACSTCIFTSKGNRCSLRVQTIGKLAIKR
jgi:hypothetical protein